MLWAVPTAHSTHCGPADLNDVFHMVDHKNHPKEPRARLLCFFMLSQVDLFLEAKLMV